MWRGSHSGRLLCSVVCKFLDSSSSAKQGESQRAGQRLELGAGCQESSCVIVSSKIQLRLELLEAVYLSQLAAGFRKPQAT